MNNNLTYTRCGGYEIPNLTLSETENKPLGKYGRMRKKYLQEHRPVLWNSMI
ncbi:MAG: TnpV protein, partial [Clostridia bacterium]|nr:TnpV protein [Clostridia bacterium]